MVQKRRSLLVVAVALSPAGVSFSDALRRLRAPEATVQVLTTLHYA